jgi:hypothetical protein
LKNSDVVKYAPHWSYLGEYTITHKFHMTPTQWRNVAERVKPKKLDPFWLRGTVKKWCEANKIKVCEMNTSKMAGPRFLKALEKGEWRFDCLVIQCIGFDRDLYESLKHVVPREHVSEETREDVDDETCSS